MPVTHYNKICSNPSISERKQEMIFLNNPMLSRLENGISRSALSETASYGGVAGKSIGLVVLVALSAITTWHFGYATPVTTGVTAIMAFIVACIVSFRPQTAGFLAPLYAILEGMCLACLSFMLERMIPGIAVSAVMATFGVAIAAGIVYSRGIVTVNAKFMRITMIALLGILILYAAQIILGLFGVMLPIHNGGAIGIGISLIVIGVATLSLFIDYEMISEAVREGMPKEYEWYCAFSLLVTLIWLYVEILSLLRQIQGSDD